MLAMIVEDSGSIRKIMARIMHELHFETTEAENGQQALEMLQSADRRPDLILIDWHMPVVDGLELVKTLRGMELYRKVPLIMVTTETDIGKITMALEAGASEYVMKPFTKEVLAEKLELLGIPRLAHGKDTCSYRG